MQNIKAKIEALIGLFLLSVGLYGCDDKPPECLERVIVKEITGVSYRSATFRLLDGREIILDQATIKPGDTVCLKWKR